MQKLIFSFLVLSLYMYAAQCDLQIQSVENSADTYTLVLKHDKACEVLMDHNANHISLVSKMVEVQTAIEKTKGTQQSKSNDKVEKIIALAKSKMGDSYEPAKAGPDHFDCSGFVYYVFKKNGIKIPRTSLLQSQSGAKLSRKEIKRGDILSFDTHDRKHINHSGIYLGEGKFIHSSSGKAYGVTISELDKGFYKDKFRWGVRKIEK
jgi:cell wall-associated NlpC family hydrolase